MTARHANIPDPAGLIKILTAITISAIIAIAVAAVGIFAAWWAIDWCLRAQLGNETAVAALAIIVVTGVWRAYRRRP